MKISTLLLSVLLFASAGTIIAAENNEPREQRDNQDNRECSCPSCKN